MYYNEAISLFRNRYERYYALGKVIPKINDVEIFTELTIIQAEIQNEYMIVDKEYVLTTVQDTYIYETGSGHDKIPADILQIWQVCVPSERDYLIFPKGVSELRGYGDVSGNKPNGTPCNYSYYLEGNSPVIEFDTIPTPATEIKITYIPQFEIYMGITGINTNYAFSDYNETMPGYGGKLKLPARFDFLTIEGALANVVMDGNLMNTYRTKLFKLIQNKPFHFSGDIPYNDGTNRWDITNREPGDDFGRL